MVIKRILIITIGLMVIVIAAAAGWYLASPLFINKTVNEAFTLQMPASAEIVLEPAAAQAGPVAGQEPPVAAAEPKPAAAAAEESEAMAAATEAEVMTGEEVAAAGENAAPVTLRQGQFVDADSFHRGSGTASIYRLPGEELLLRLSDFEVTNGPDLHVLLAAQPAPSSSEELGEYLDLGPLKGNIGNQNYDIPAGTDLSLYNSVVIYCKPFHVIFSTASLAGSEAG